MELLSILLAPRIMWVVTKFSKNCGHLVYINELRSDNFWFLTVQKKKTTNNSYTHLDPYKCDGRIYESWTLKNCLLTLDYRK